MCILAPFFCSHFAFTIFALSSDDKTKPSFKLEPKLNVMGEWTPSVSSVMNKLEADKESIPKHLHQSVTDNFEAQLKALVTFFRTIDQCCSGTSTVDKHN